jgi:hypothetical protein
MVKESLVDRVPLSDQTTFKNSLQPGYSEGSDHTLQGLRYGIYIFSSAGILKLLLGSGRRNSDWLGSGSEKSDGREVAPLPYIGYSRKIRNFVAGSIPIILKG